MIYCMRMRLVKKVMTVVIVTICVLLVYIKMRQTGSNLSDSTIYDVQNAPELKFDWSPEQAKQQENQRTEISYKKTQLVNDGLSANQKPAAKLKVESQVIPKPVAPPVGFTCYQKPPMVYSFYTERDSFCLAEDKTEYFRRLGKLTCLIEGTDFLKTEGKSNQECVCVAGWHGQECSLPDIVFDSSYPYHYGISYRDKNRRIIYAMPVNHEFDLVEVKVMELYDVIDVFVLLESNITAAGHPKKTAFLEKLKNGWLSQYHKKIIYLKLTSFPKEAYVNGWVMDGLLRNHIGRKLFNTGGVLHGVRKDDIVIMNDADEIPIRDALLFLKVNNGFPEPFGFIMRHRMFGFFWRTSDDIINIYGGATVNFVRNILHNETYFLRNPGKITDNDAGLVGRYRHDHHGRIHAWSFGKSSSPAGWHCSYCFSPEGVRYKLISAHVGDTPRWGSVKHLSTIPYITNLIQSGHWFDNKTTFLSANERTADYAPRTVLSNQDRFKYLLTIEAAIQHSDSYDNLLQQNPT